MKHLLFLLGCCWFLGCEPKDQKLASQKQTMGSEKPKNLPATPKRFNYPKPDLAGKVFYASQYYTQEALTSLKEKELIVWQQKLAKKYGQKFKVKHFSKYFNVAYRCTDAEASTLEYVTNYFLYEPEHPFQIVYFTDKPKFTKHTNSTA